MIFNIGSKDVTKREDVRSMLLHLEDEYRKANISEKNYAELKRKYTEKLGKRDKIFDRKPDKQEDVIMVPKIDRKKEKDDISLFLESLEDQFRRGEINKEEYDNIRDINLERLKDIDYVEISPDDVEEEDEGLEEIKLEVKEEEKKGVIQKLFGSLKKRKKEEGKVEVKVPEEMNKDAPEEFELEENPESGELELKSWEITEEPKLEINENEPQDVIEEVEIPEEKVEEMPEETVEEKPKKKGFLKSIFGNKKKEEPKPEEVPEEVPKEKNEEPEPEKHEEEVKNEEPKHEEAPKEEPKSEEKKEERLEPGEIEEVTPEVIERLAAQMAEDQGAEQIEEPEETSETADEGGARGPTTNSLNVEIEKLKVMLDTVRDSKRATDETIQNFSESMGEIRSLVMQTDANFKTSLSKMERMEDDVSAVRPKEITKKFNDVKENLEKKELELEKINQKLKGTTEKVNEVHEMLKSIGGVENLAGLNKDIQDKLRDITEAIKYIQRIGTRTEKIFIDLSKGMEDLILLKAKQEDYDESLKNVLSSIDSFNIKFKDYLTKDDLNVFREENMIIKKEMDKINKILPVAELKLPEEIIKLRKEREDIEMFLESLEAQFVSNSINKAEYEDVRRSNLKKLSEIEGKLEKEWKSISGMLNEEKPETEETPEEKKEIKKKTKKKARKRLKSESSRKKKILSDLKKMK